MNTILLMEFFMGAFSFLGNTIGATGRVLGLPELGVSEALGGSGIDGNGDNRIKNVNPNMTASQSLAAIQHPQVLDASVVPGQGNVINPAAQAAAAQAAQAAATAAANDAAINGALGRLDQQGTIGNQNILNSYNSAYQRLMNGQTSALGNLDQNRTQAIQDNIIAKDSINGGVRQTNQGLQRLLGAHGAGSSSAASILAPYAAGLQGNQQQAQVQNAFGHNMSALDQTVADTKRQYEDSFGDLGVQRDAQKNSLLAGLAQQRASLLGQRSDAANNVGQINSILDGATKLGLTPTYTPKAVTVAAPNLEQYNYDKTAAPTMANGNQAAASQLGVYQTLLNPDKKKLGAVV